MDQAQAILTFWFGDAAQGISKPEVAALWYKKDATFDRDIRDRFLDVYLSILRGEHADWLREPTTSLAYVIALDQFSRNMFRDTPLAFAADPVALTAAQAAIAAGHDRALLGDMRAFMYLPLMHSEDLTVQEQCVRCFEGLCAELEGELKQRFENNLSFAIKHRDIVARFGRFPHRNKILGRRSSDEELSFLTQPGSAF